MRKDKKAFWDKVEQQKLANQCVKVMLDQDIAKDEQKKFDQMIREGLIVPCEIEYKV